MIPSQRGLPPPPLPAATAVGFAVGALAYGAPIAWAHLRLNPGLPPGEALALVALQLLGYGGAAAVLFVLAGFAARFAPRLGVRGGRGNGGFLPALFVTQVVFWLPFFLHGLTYEQTLVLSPRTAPGMTAYLALAAVVIGAAVFALSAVQNGLLRRLLRRPRALALACGVVLLALPLVLGLTAGAAPERAPAETPAPLVDPARPEVAAHRTKVVLVGLDGADPRVLERLVARGELPTFAHLIAEGTSGRLATLPDANSAVIWASIYTGTAPRVHRIRDLYRLSLPGVPSGVFPVHRTFWKEAASPLVELGLAGRTTVTRGDLAAPQLWEIADWAGLETAVIDGYLCSFPAMAPQVAGSRFVAYGADGYARQLAAGTLSAVELELFFSPAALFGELRALLDQPDFAWQSAVALRLLERPLQPHFLSLYTHEPDTIQHQWWRTFEPERFYAATTPADADHIPAMYRAFDRFLGALVARLEPGTALLVVSDHGHAATLVHDLDSQHRHGPPGMVLLFGAPFRAGATLERAHVYDIAPSVLHLLGLPVPRDLPGRVWTEALTPELLSQNPVRATDSYAALGPPRSGVKRHRLLDQQEIEKLKALGYL